MGISVQQECWWWNPQLLKDTCPLSDSCLLISLESGLFSSLLQTWALIFTSTPMYSPRALDKEKPPIETGKGQQMCSADWLRSWWHITPARQELHVKAGGLPGPVTTLPSLGRTHLGLHEEDSFPAGPWPVLVCDLLELSHMVSLLRQF